MNHILLKKASGGSNWVYDSANKEYSLVIDGTTVAIIDQYGNLKIKGRVLKI